MPRDTWVLLRHQLRLDLGNRFGLLFVLLQPVLYLVLFGPLLTKVQGPESWRDFVPGILVQLSLMSSGLAGFGVVFDARFGKLERLRVTPVSRSALLMGRVLSNAVQFTGQATLLVLVGLAFGFRAAVPGLLAGFALLVPTAMSLAALSYAFALVLRRKELFAPFTSTVVVPLLLLSGALLPMSLAPGWLDVLSRATPFRYVVEALRAAFAGHYFGGTLAAGALVTLALTAIGLIVGTRTFMRESR